MNAHSVRLANFKVSEYANDKLWSALYMTNELNMFPQWRAFLASLYVIQ